MKLKETFYLLKRNNSHCIVLLKSGNFYVTFDSDATILNYIFSYQIVNGKVGFPITNITKITEQLHNKSINYIIYNGEDSEIIKVKGKLNNYSIYCEKSKKLEYKSAMKEMLIDRIKFLINDNEDNYNKIRRFIDEF